MAQERMEVDQKTRKVEKTWCIEDFELQTVLGHGQFGKVYLAQEKKSQYPVALKMIKKSSLPLDRHEQVFNEIAIHLIFRHPRIIQMHTYFHDNNFIYTVMEYASSNNLFRLLRSQKFKRFNESTAAKYVCQVAEGLRYMHRRMYFHRDVKPENILIDAQGNAKLGDFGLAAPSITKAHGYYGTPEYMAPEIILEKVYNHTVDNWCLGVMAFEVLVGRSPFKSSKPKAVREKILEGKVKFPQVVKADARNMITKLIVTDRQKRLSLDRVLQHNWIQTHYPRGQCPSDGEP